MMVCDLSPRDERLLSVTRSLLLATAFSADGALITLRFRDGTLRVCQPAAGEEVWERSLPTGLES